MKRKGLSTLRDALGEVQSLLLLGGTSEIGLAIADRLVTGRCKTVVLAGRRPDALEKAAERLRKIGANRVETVAFDAQDIEHHGEVIGGIFDELSDLDVAIVAFGVLGDQEELDSNPVAAAELMDVNLTGAVSAGLVLAERFRAQGHGTIVVLSSVAGERVRAENFVYGASKAGLDAFALGLGDALGGTGVDVMVVRPGFVHTRMTAGRTPAPFATTPQVVADVVIDGMAKGKTIVWAPPVLRWVFAVFRHLPRPLWRKITAAKTPER